MASHTANIEVEYILDGITYKFQRELKDGENIDHFIDEISKICDNLKIEMKTKTLEVLKP